MEWFGTFPVDRGAGDRGAFSRGEQLLRGGAVVGIFPQGTCLPYRVRPWHRGAAKLALRTGAPIVPVCIVGSERALRPGKPRLGLPRIRLIVGEPIKVEIAKPTIASARDLTSRIEHAVEELRKPYGPPEHAWFPESSPA
jgi:1-acyl-sn-glycerol-3-phosphate acyltransferase